MFIFPASQIAFWLEGSALSRLQPRGLGTTLYLRGGGGRGGRGRRAWVFSQCSPVVSEPGRYFLPVHFLGWLLVKVREPGPLPGGKSLDLIGKF